VAVYAGAPIFLKSLDCQSERHTAGYISDTICDIIDGEPSVGEKIRSVVNDNPSVMVAAWCAIEVRKPHIKCYGCAAHISNLLASDFRKLNTITEVLNLNKQIAMCFKKSSMSRDVLLRTTKEKYGKEPTTVLSVATRWSTDYFMVRRNIPIRYALLIAISDPKIAKAVKAAPDVQKAVLDSNHEFWFASERVVSLLQPVSRAIQHCEGDAVSVNVMPHIWAYISA